MAFAEALETIPLTLAENAGLDVISIDVKLKSAHNRGKKWYGVDVFKRGLADMMASEVLEPLLVKEQVIKSATEVASMILRVDDVVAASKMKEKPSSKQGGGMPYGMPYGGLG